MADEVTTETTGGEAQAATAQTATLAATGATADPTWLPPRLEQATRSGEKRILDRFKAGTPEEVETRLTRLAELEAAEEERANASRSEGEKAQAELAKRDKALATKDGMIADLQAQLAERDRREAFGSAWDEAGFRVDRRLAAYKLLLADGKLEAVNGKAPDLTAVVAAFATEYPELTATGTTGATVQTFGAEGRNAAAAGASEAKTRLETWKQAYRVGQPQT